MKKIAEIRCQRCLGFAAFTDAKFKLPRFRKRFVFCVKCYNEIRLNDIKREMAIAQPITPRGRILVHRGWITFGMICLVLATLVGIIRLL
jgi:hypothetical protein